MLRTWVVVLAAVLVLGVPFAPAEEPAAGEAPASDGILYEGDPGGETDPSVDFAVIDTLDEGSLEGDPIANAGSEERGRRIGELIKKHDADGDGKLSEEEKKAALEAMKKNRIDFLKKRLAKKADADGDGQMTDAENTALDEMTAKAQEKAAEIRAKVVTKFDANGDGSLDLTEKKSLREAFMKRKGGRMGGGGDRGKGGRKGGKRGDHPKGEHPKGGKPADEGSPDAPEEGDGG